MADYWKMCAHYRNYYCFLNYLLLRTSNRVQFVHMYTQVHTKACVYTVAARSAMQSGHVKIT